MRLDKYLKVSRLIKRRTMAKEVASQGRVKVNGQAAKPGTEVKPGDELEVLFGQKHMTIRIDRVEESAKKEDAATFYSILKEERVDNN
ncbi:RNA-binding S4 domain-containing protein [Salipaludibacillus agaradhaerens]|uniref:RQC P-site tRNA stabilizing factor n=1 Tax=Salipaludibacillus agaradhaerens TaxID=76935 RepID=A0A9Q4G0V7_SALAG|nr:RNA-binding S4 domain-containing protein [Salipaludibacillus agaradhaerens]UJW56002.1 RNA-binding S4 domain-containing protein [Bacillus sp. A116_S68]MCR6098402.1 RNA-binding S4 domain-containing protein [Salipaludibacillus agaradhaerens]MCR6104761.1 RNA-binding S4 domain-containing protein [Salipaludibacillus agaradhaerens]MCR6115968.1 RNA-binding S4 domain-containing protein [Salipaludibacillus agaradhaerens]MCR6116809.1 RNA-binding S4 domain-containing protein [Salipaludibacillus agaradh